MNTSDEPWSEENARLRLTQLARAAPINVEGARFLPSLSNDVWGVGEAILRVCWRGDRRRFVKEAALLTQLPAEVGCPPLLDAGMAGGLAWTLTRRLDGVTLDQTWGDGDEGRLKAILADYARKLRALHGWIPTGEAADLLAEHAAASCPTPDLVTGHDVVPLPMPRAAALAGHVRTLPYVDPGVADAAWARMLELAELDPFRAPHFGRVAHSDAAYQNILVAGDRVSALLDFEWARLGPPWVELNAWVRLLDDLRLQGERPPPILKWLEAVYPALFDAPRLGEGLWLTELAYAFRHITCWPPTGPEADLPIEHPLFRLRRLIDAPLDWD